MHIYIYIYVYTIIQIYLGSVSIICLYILMYGYFPVEGCKILQLVDGQNVSHYDPIIYQYLAIVIVIP